MQQALIVSLLYVLLLIPVALASLLTKSFPFEVGHTS